MRTINSLNEAIFEAERRWSLQFKTKNNEEACSPCPWCGGHDRFLIFHTGYYMCRPGDGHCGKTGWIIEGEHEPFSPMELRVLALEREQAVARKKLEDHERRIEALEQMEHNKDHLRYYDNVDRDYWHEEGINDESIKRWMLGYCEHCPTDYKKRPSYTIPVINLGKLRNIRHRIAVECDPNDRYRPHMKGLGNTLFYADALFKPDKSMVILWEGEKKSIVCAQNGFDGPGVMGIQGFQKEWVKWFLPFGKVYVCYDPDATEKAAKDAALFGSKGRVVELPIKADDFWGIGGTRREFSEFIRKAREA